LDHFLDHFLGLLEGLLLGTGFASESEILFWKVLKCE
jgi:hypothetical protein